MAAPYRLAGQGEALEAFFGESKNFCDRALEVASGDRAGRDHAVLVLAELFPRPVVPYPALRHGELRVGRRPHGEPLVGEDQLDIDAVAIVVGQPPERIGAGLVARHVLTLERGEAQAVGAVALADAPLHAILVGDHARQALVVLLVHAVEPQRGRLVGMSVGRDHEVFPGCIGPGAARPVGAGRFETPAIGFVDDDLRSDLAHRFLLLDVSSIGSSSSSCSIWASTRWQISRSSGGTLLSSRNWISVPTLATRTARSWPASVR